MTKGQQTRARIVARAADVFNVQGYAGTSMGDLTRVAEIEKGGIYNYFASKEALALAAFDYAVDLIGAKLQHALAGKEHAVDRLLAIISVFQSHVENPPLPGGCPVLNTATEADDTNPALRERAQQAMTGWQKLIGVTVKHGVARGELRAGTDPRDVSAVLTATLEGALMLSRLYDDPAYLERAVAHLRGYLATQAVPHDEQPTTGGE